MGYYASENVWVCESYVAPPHKMLTAITDMRTDKPAHLIIRLLVGFASDSVFVKLNKDINKY